MRSLPRLALIAVLGLAAVLPAQAALISIAPFTFSSNTQTITFGGLADDGTINPAYTVASGLTVSFGLYFVGQVLTSSPADGGLYYLSGTTPSGPLTLASDSDNVSIITTDAATADPDNERLAGAAPYQFLGPVAILFSVPVKQVAFTAGVFSEAGDLIIEAFSASRMSLGTVSNTGGGDPSFYLADSNGAAIAGLSLYIPDQSLNGFSIDDVMVESAAASPPPTTMPEPATLPMMVFCLLVSLMFSLRLSRP